MSKAKLPSNRASSGPEVLVDEEDYEDGELFIFHDPRRVASTFDMVEIPESEAREMGAVGCSKCFRDVDCTDYPFPYKHESGLFGGLTGGLA